MALLLVSHQLTGYWDLRYAGSKRTITLLEQQIHSFLEMMPLLALVLVILTNWNTFLDLLGVGSGVRSWDFILMQPAFPLWYLVALATCVVAFSVVPSGMNSLPACDTPEGSLRSAPDTHDASTPMRQRAQGQCQRWAAAASNSLNTSRPRLSSSAFRVTSENCNIGA